MSDPMPYYTPMPDALTTVVRDVLDEYPAITCWRDAQESPGPEIRLLAAWLQWHGDPAEFLTEQHTDLLLDIYRRVLLRETSTYALTEELRRLLTRYAHQDIDAAIQQEVTDRQEREARAREQGVPQRETEDKYRD